MIVVAGTHTSFAPYSQCDPCVPRPCGSIKATILTTPFRFSTTPRGGILRRMSEADLPLLHHTPASWADAVLSLPLALLNDHAHLEKKAAANALELLNRW